MMDHSSQVLRAALLQAGREEIPQTSEQQEAYFQEQVAHGEKLATMGMSILTSPTPI